MTTSSNTPDKPITREEAFQLALHDSRYITISLSDVLDYSPISTSQFRHVFSAGESFARQSLVKEMEEELRSVQRYGYVRYDGSPHENGMEKWEGDNDHEWSEYGVGSCSGPYVMLEDVLAKLKGEGV